VRERERERERECVCVCMLIGARGLSHGLLFARVLLLLLPCMRIGSERFAAAEIDVEALLDLSDHELGESGRIIAVACGIYMFRYMYPRAHACVRLCKTVQVCSGRDGRTGGEGGRKGGREVFWVPAGAV